MMSNNDLLVKTVVFKYNALKSFVLAVIGRICLVNIFQVNAKINSCSKQSNSFTSNRSIDYLVAYLVSCVLPRFVSFSLNFGRNDNGSWGIFSREGNLLKLII